MGFWAALPMILSSGVSIYGATKTPKEATRTTTPVMSPQRKAMLRLMTEMMGKRMRGIQTPEEHRQIAEAGTAADVGARNAMRLLETSNLTGGARERMAQGILESSIASKVGATQQISQQQYQEAKNAGMQLALRGPVGQKTIMPVDQGAAWQGAGESMGLMSAMLPYLLGQGKTADPGTTPTPTPAVASQDPMQMWLEMMMKYNVPKGV